MWQKYLWLNICFPLRQVPLKQEIQHFIFYRSPTFFLLGVKFFDLTYYSKTKAARQECDVWNTEILEAFTWKWIFPYIDEIKLKWNESLTNDGITIIGSKIFIDKLKYWKCSVTCSIHYWQITTFRKMRHWKKNI